MAERQSALARALLSFKRPTRPHRTATVPIIRSFHLEIVLRQILHLQSQSSKPNELILNAMFYDNVCLKGPHGCLIWILVSEHDHFEYCDVASMASYSQVTSSMTSPIDAP